LSANDEHEEGGGVEEGLDQIDNSTRSLLTRTEVASGYIVRKGLKPNGHKIWPKAAGKYTIAYCKGDSSLTSKAYSKFKAAALGITEACEDIVFEEKTKNAGDCTMKVVGEGSGCWAHLGYIGGGTSTNKVHLMDGKRGYGTCATTGIATHEILHALGQMHEQTRSDAEQHVKIYWGNIKDASAGQYKEDPKESTDATYDYASIMHYGCDAFKKSNRWPTDTIRAHRRRRWFDGAFGRYDCVYQMGQRSGMSSKDVVQLQKMYSCASRRRAPPPPATRRRRRWWS